MNTKTSYLILISIFLIFPLVSCVSRTVKIDSDPTNSTISLDGTNQGVTPFKTSLTWTKKDLHWFNIERRNYQSERVQLSYFQAERAPNPWNINVRLEPLLVKLDIEIETIPEGAAITIDGQPVGNSPISTLIEFTRSSGYSSWSKPVIKARLRNYKDESVYVPYESSKNNPYVSLNLDEIRREIPIDITSNIDGAIVEAAGIEIGKTPLRHTFIFKRTDANQPWNTYLIVGSKEGFRYRRLGVKHEPGKNLPFRIRIHADGPIARSRKLHINFEPIRFVRTPVWRVTWKEEGMEIEEKWILSQVGEIEREPKVLSVTRITDAKPEDAFIESRISIHPEDSQTIVYSFPFKLPGKKVVYMNLWSKRWIQNTRLTDAQKYDIEATISNDGRWIYFSSNRLIPNRWNIWRIGTSGKGGMTKITDSPSSRIDTEPAVSPDFSKIAYTSYLLGVKKPQIWTAEPDGNLPTQLRVGMNPSWSPDSKKLVFSAPDSAGKMKIWTMFLDGRNPTQLTSGDQGDKYPIWSPNGQHIIYASNAAVNEEGERNYDIWMMQSNGSSKTQLTVNGSYDSRPIVSQNGEYIYFISNRGARKEGQPSLQVWRIELADKKLLAY